MNKNLTPEQKHILHEEGTESPGSSHLNFEKREGDYYCAECELNFLSRIKNMKVVRVGHLFLNHYPTYLKLKLTT